MGRGSAATDNFPSWLNIWATNGASNSGAELLSGYSFWDPSAYGGSVFRQNGIPVFLQFQAYNTTAGTARGMYLDNLSSTGTATATVATPCV